MGKCDHKQTHAHLSILPSFFLYLSLSIYIYIFIFIYLFIYIFLCFFLSLFLSSFFFLLLLVFRINKSTSDVTS